MLFKLGALFCIIAGTMASNEKPRFKYSQTNTVMLSWDDTWEVGSSSMLAFLNPDKKQQLTIEIVVEGNVGKSMRRILEFKCSQGEAKSTMDMEILTSEWKVKECSNTIPFSVKLKEQDQFAFILLPSDRPYTRAFTDKIELRVRVEHSFGVLESNSLFVWNLDAIGKMNADRSGYGRRFLTDQAVGFLKKMDMPENIASIRFLDHEMSIMIANAPQFLKSKINIGAILYFDAGRCDQLQIGRASLFVNYHSKLDDRNMNLLKHIYLDTETGLLHYSRPGLSLSIFEIYHNIKPSEIGICATLSFAGQNEAYEEKFAIAERIDTNKLSYKKLSSRNHSCRIVYSNRQKSVTIFSGMDYTPLVCPIICDNQTQVYRFFHGDKSLLPDTQRDWTEVDGIRVSKTGNIIELPPAIYNRHFGDFRCEAGGMKFTFKANVVSMPQFASKFYASSSASSSSTAISGNLPSTIYAMEGERLSYNCTAYFTNVLSTDISPVFYSFNSSDEKWLKLTQDDFNSLVAPRSGDVPLLVTKAKQTESITLTYKIGSVPPAKTSPMLNFTHRAVCDVSVAACDTEKVGMASYNVQSGSNVFFLSRPLLSSFEISTEKNCSLQSCMAAQGAFFRFSLKPELVAYLTSIGVTVKGYFKIDNAYLEFVKVLNAPGVAKISYDSASTNLTLNINPFAKPGVLEELQKLQTLTPVFNFRYKDGSKAPNLVLDKSRHGQPDLVAGIRDCRADNLCFYSTDFDANSTLQRLMLSLEF